MSELYQRGNHWPSAVLGVRHNVPIAADRTYSSQVVSAATGSTSVTIDGLTNGTEYTVQIRAHNVAGHSPGWVSTTGTPSS